MVEERNIISKKHAFNLPDGIVYLDGNSLGVLPKAAQARAQQVVADEWGAQLITAWNDAGWIDLPEKVGNKIGKLIGAPEGCVTACDSTSINLYKVLNAAFSLCEGRNIVLSDKGNFPTDLYIAQGICAERGKSLKLVQPEEILASLTGDVGVLMLTQVDYRTGRKYDIELITREAHALGIIVIWDLAHSAGAFPVDLEKADADFAVGCGYKYLNGGPGASAFIYVKRDLHDKVPPALQGWMGHKAPFAFDVDYQPAEGMHKMLVGTPSIIGLSVLDSALDVWDGVDLNEIWQQSQKLSTLFISLIEAGVSHEQIQLVSPRDAKQRGSQVSFAFENGYAAIQALIAEGVIGDFRAPNIMRFGFTPLYIDESDVEKAAATLIRVINEREWDQPQFLKKAKVT